MRSEEKNNKHGVSTHRRLQPHMLPRENAQTKQERGRASAYRLKPR